MRTVAAASIAYWPVRKEVELIDDLLELGRVTRVEIKRRQVDLSE